MIGGARLKHWIKKYHLHNHRLTDVAPGETLLYRIPKHSVIEKLLLNFIKFSLSLNSCWASLNVYVILRDVKDGVHSQKGWSNTGEKAEPCMLAYSWFICHWNDWKSSWSHFLKKKKNNRITFPEKKKQQKWKNDVDIFICIYMLSFTGECITRLSLKKVCNCLEGCH